MKVNELRIGNIVSDGIFLFKVVEISSKIVKGFSTIDGKEIYEDTLYSLDVKKLVGVPLNENWYKILRFNFHQGVWYDRTLSNMVFSDGRFFSVCETGGEWYINTVNCVHELQNLYYAVENEELKFR